MTWHRRRLDGLPCLFSDCGRFYVRRVRRRMWELCRSGPADPVIPFRKLGPAVRCAAILSRL